MADMSWTNNPKIRNLDPRKLTALIELMKQAEGKPLDKVLPLLMTTNKRLQEQNLMFNKEETDIMIKLLTKNLSPKEKMQFDMFRKMMMTQRGPAK